MDNQMQNTTKHDGFTLAELLIVVAIIGVLVAIAIPIFRQQKEKAARAVDIDTARNIQSALANLVNGGDVVPAGKYNNSTSANGIWVIVSRDKDSHPKYYPGAGASKDSTTFTCADVGVSILGESNKKYNNNNKNLAQYLKDCGLDPASLSCKSSGYNSKVDGIEGWDWFIVEYTYNITSKEYECWIYSGKAGAEASYITGDQRQNKGTGIEQWMKRTRSGSQL